MYKHDLEEWRGETVSKVIDITPQRTTRLASDVHLILTLAEFSMSPRGEVIRQESQGITDIAYQSHHGDFD